MAISVTDDDGVLVLEHLGGEPGAFDVLYRRYFPRLARFCARATRCQSTAEDIAQETLIRAFDHLDRFDSTRPMWPWLKTIATRLLIDHLRRSARELPVEDTLESGTGDREGVQSHAELAEERSVLLQALSALPERQRDAVALRYLEDWDGTKVAEHLGLSGLALRQMLLRARRRLQTEYRKVSEAALGAIVLPAGWLRRMSDRMAGRLQRLHAPSAGQAVAAVTALNLTVAAVAILGGGQRADAAAEAARPEPVRVRSIADPTPKERKATEPATTEHAAPPAAGGHPGATRPGPATERVKEAGAVVEDVVDPNRDVSQPEDASILSFEYSPRFEHDGIVFATGAAHCRVAPCPPVLFRSTDGGASWSRLEAKGFHGTQVLLPPAYPEDGRIFAMGATGLQVSQDGGESFGPATAGGGLGTGSAAISPLFNSGDPRILIGDQSLMQYRDDARAVGPTEPVPGRGPLFPAFSPDYANNGVLFVGGLQVDPETAAWAPSVFRCSDSMCTGTPLAGPPQITEVRFAPDYRQTGLMYAFTENDLFVSRDQGETFSSVVTWGEAIVDDVLPLRGGTILAITRTPTGTAALHASGDGGATWDRREAAVLDGGVVAMAASGDTLLVALGAGGLACSVDDGLVWSGRCGQP